MQEVTTAAGTGALVATVIICWESTDTYLRLVVDSQDHFCDTSSFQCLHSTRHSVSCAPSHAVTFRCALWAAPILSMYTGPP
jgi:hypothetical protein